MSNEQVHEQEILAKKRNSFVNGLRPVGADRASPLAAAPARAAPAGRRPFTKLLKRSEIASERKEGGYAEGGEAQERPTGYQGSDTGDIQPAFSPSRRGLAT